MIEETLSTLLRSVCDQSYPVTVPRGIAAPFVCWTRVSTPRIRDMAGSTGWGTPLFQVDVYGLTFAATRALATSVRTLLEAYRDAHLLSIACEQEVDDSDLTTSPDLFRVRLEFRVVHKE